MSIPQNAQAQQQHLQMQQQFQNAPNMNVNTGGAMQQPSSQHINPQQQQQQMGNMAQGSMMPPPTSFPPRPNTASSHRPQQASSYAYHNAPSPRPNTSGGPGATPSPRISSGPLPGGNVPGPVPIQPRPRTGTPTPMTRPGTSMSGHVSMGGQDGGGGQGQQKVPSRPTTASGFAQQQQQQQQPQQQQQGQQQPQQQGQNAPFLSVNTANTPQQMQSAKSPGGFTPIAPAPTQPGSPVRGAKRKTGGTPVHGQQPQQAQSQTQSHLQSQQAPQTPRLSIPPIANMGGTVNGGASGTGLIGMGIMGNVGPSGQPQVAQSGMGAGVGLLGGAGGGTMGPPVLPRSASQGQIQQQHSGDMSSMGMGMTANMNAGGMFPGQGMVRQSSSGSLNVSPTFPGVPTPAHLQLSSNPAAGLSVTSPIQGHNYGQNAVTDPTVAARNMAGLTNGIGLGLGTPSVGSIGGIDMPVPQTPLQQHVRQTSQPPISSPFPNVSSPIVGNGMSGMLAAQAGLGQTSQHGVLADRKLGLADGVGLGITPNNQGSLPQSDGTPSKTGPSVNGVHASASHPTPAPALNIIAQLPPLPANVQLNPKVTRVSVVPLKESTVLIPPLTDDEIADIKAWMKVDKEYEVTYKHMREQMQNEMRETVAKPRAWFEKDPTVEDGRSNSRRRPDKFALTGLKQARDREAKERRKSGRREGFKLYVVLAYAVRFQLILAKA